MSKLKYFLFISVLIVSCFSISCYASTSDSLYEQSLVESMIAQNGSNYESPFIAAGGNVELSDGNVNVNEVDLSLPGKNGMDVNIRRIHYVNGKPGSYYGVSTNGSVATSPMYLYNYVLNGVSKTAYVAFDKEENLTDEFYTTSSLLGSNMSTDTHGTKYYEYSSIKSASGILMTRDKNKPSVQNYQLSNEVFAYMGKNSDVEIGYGWYVAMPQISQVNVSGSSYIKRYTYLFEDENGQTMNFTYEFDLEGTKWVFDPESCNVSAPDSQYNAQVYSDNQTHALGFQYDVVITDGDGKSYYFLKGINKNCLPAAIIDRYGNTVRYAANSSGVAVTDTFGRNIQVSSSGITVTKGSYVKSVEYRLVRSNDTTRDPSGLLSCFSKYSLQVRKYNGSGYETTEYVSHKSSIQFISKEVYYYDKIEKIIYPTNASVEYEYETTPTVKKFSSSTGRYKISHKDYHIKKEIAYEDGSEKYSKTYSFYQYIQNAATVPGDKERYVTVNETYDDGSSKSMNYNYDYAGRLYEIKGSIDGKVYNEQYTYSSNSNKDLSSLGSSTMLALRKANMQSVITTYGGNIINVTYDKYNNRNQPTYSLNGEKEITYTYDDSFGLLLTKNYKKDDSTPIRIQNSKTSDGKSIASSKIYENNAEKSTTSYTYNSDGTIASQTVTPSVGAQVTTVYSYTYNPDGSYRLTSTVNNVSDTDGNNSSVTTVQNYDWLGNLVSATDPNGNTFSYQYDGLGRLVKQINPDGTYQTASYNIADNSVTVTDENGNVTTQDYTPLGYLDKIYLDNNQNNIAAQYTYDNHGRKTSETAYQSIGGKKVTENYTYDQFDRVVSQTSKEDNTALDTVGYEYSYGDGFSKSESNITITVPSSAKKLLAVFHNTSVSASSAVSVKNGSTVYFADSVSAKGARSVLVDVSNLSTVSLNKMYGKIYYKYLTDDDLSKNITLLGGASQTVKTTYTGDSTYVKPTVETVLDGLGNKASETYYKHGTSTVLNKNTYKYDYMGNVLETKGGRTYTENLGDYTSKAEYDYMGNPTKTYRTDGSYMTAAYDGYGNVLSQTDYMGNTTTMEYDRLGRAIKAAAPFNGSEKSKTLTYYDGTRDIYTQYAYDNAGNMVKTVTGQTSKIADLYGTLPDAAASQTYEYDRFGNVIKATDGLGKSSTAAYNLMGLPVTETDRNGNVKTMTFNAYGSPLTVSVTNGETITNTYSKNNLLISAKQGSSTVSYTYDDYGYVKTENSNGIVNTYTNDVEGNRRNYTQKEGTNTYINASYTYDKLSRMTNVNFGNGISAGYTYNANNQVSKETRGSLITSYGYRESGQLSMMTTTNGSWTQGYMYDYNLSGNQILKRSIDSENNIFDDTTYTYDNLGQLLSETSANYYAAYMYDTRGNIKQKKEGDNNPTYYSYDKNNRLTFSSNEYGLYTFEDSIYEYDGNGNRVKTRRNYYDDGGDESVDIGYDEFKYGYDAYNRQISYYNYEVDYVGDYEDETTATYTYDAIGRRASKKVDGATTTHRWDGSSIVGDSGTGAATYYRGINIIAQNKNNAVNYYVYDGHGNTVTLTDANGATVSKCDYSAYGNRTSIKSYINTPFKYCGEYQDNESGMVYLRNRYYKINEGRFTQEDPAKDGLNWYAYCGNNPVNFVDPFGLDSIKNYCTNEDKLTLEQKKAMNSAINAYHDGVLSYGDMLENLALNGGTISELAKGPAVVAEMVGSDLNITVYANIESIEIMATLDSGEKVKGIYTQENYSMMLNKDDLGDIEYLNSGGITFKEILCKGIESWSGSVNGININVNVVYGKSNTNKTVKVNFLYGKRENSESPGLVSNIYYEMRVDSNDMSVRNFSILCGHEAGGHAAFNFSDAYVKSSGITNISSIMGDGIQYVTDLDRAMLLRAYTYGFNINMKYQENIDLLNIYSPGWKYKERK